MIRVVIKSFCASPKIRSYRISIQLVVDRAGWQRLHFRGTLNPSCKCYLRVDTKQSFSDYLGLPLRTVTAKLPGPVLKTENLELPGNLCWLGMLGLPLRTENPKLQKYL